LSDITVNTYPLEATYNNSNYDVTIIPNEYYISPRPLTISFGTKEYNYDSINRYDDIISEVVIVNTAFEDIKNMKFKLYQGEEWDSEVNSFENAGTYKLKLEAHDVLNNYTINQEEEIYKINPFAVEFVINKMTKIYNEVIEQKDYSIQEVSLYDDIANIATFNYVLHEKSEMSTFSLKTASASAVTTTKPDAGTYTINLELTDNGLLGNYDVTIIENELVVEQRETELKTENTSKFYDEQAMDFTAEVYGKKDQEKLDTNPTLEYTFTRDGQPTKEILLVGRYSILVRYSGDRNHIGTEKVFELEVKTNEIIITDYVKEKVFDGEAFTPSYSYSMSKTVDIASKIKCEITDLEGNSAEAINVGDYLIVLSIDDSGYKIDENTFKFNITKANVTATIDTVSIEYSVTFKPEDATYTCTTGNVEKDPIVLEYEIVDYNGAAGEYIINGKNKNDNYSVTVVPGKLIVSKKNIIVEYEGNDELVYSEQKYDDLCKANVSNYLTQNDYDVYYENIKHNKVEEVRDAGTYYLVVELKDTNNFTINSQEIDKLYKTIVVNIKVLSLKINIETQKTYDGKSIDVDSVYADENIVNSSIYSVNYYKNQINISAPNTYGDYVVEIVPQNANNYKFENNTKAFSILKRNVTIEPIAAEYTYTRAAIMPDLILNNVVTGDESKVYLSPEYVDNGGKFIEVGTYSINVLQLRGPSANNYNLITEETTLSYAIVQARANVNINNTIFPFTNTKITRDMLEITFESELSILDSDYTLSELPHETGDYSITFSSANNGIVFDISSFDICIQKGRIEGIVFEGKSVDFDNNTHTLYVNKLELENGIKLGAEYFNNSHKHAGSYHATVILKNKNYHDLTLTATLEINRIDLFIPVSAQTKYIYNGQRQGKDILGLENLWYSQLISYNYIGKDGSSILKPTNAGNYELQITALNEGDINITNTIQDNSFVIETKGLTLKNLDNQVYTYDGTSKQFNLIVTGQANQENPIISIKYEGSSLLPKDAGEYKVTFEKVAGALEDNYHIINGNETALLIINAKEITIKADEKSVVYGEAELPLTHSSVELCDGDALTGSIIREEGDYVRSYLISKGTLSAGKNYKIHFVPAYYNITARTITAKSFQTNFTYNGKQQIPEVEFNNVLAKDGKVVKVSAIGDTVNAGSYTLQFMLLDSNYVINEQTIYQISIDKQDITDNIIGLISTNKDYNGNRFEPIALISGGYKYVLSYKLNSSDVNEIRNAGTYDVKISIDDRNYKGEKTCKFTINKINYSIDIIDNIVVNVRSNGFDISGLDNIAVSSDGVNFNDGKVINGLQPKTSYNLFVEVKESENYKSTIFNLGNVSTCASAVILNEQIASLITQKIEFSNISQIKEILRDYEALSASEEAMIDDENLQSFVNQYNGYINELNREIENIRMASDIVNLESARKTRASLSVYASVLALGMLQFKKGKKKNEHKN